MIVLDANVLSQIMKSDPDKNVLLRVDSIPTLQTAFTAVTVAEILYGIRRLPVGARRQKLMTAAESIFDEEFRNRILVFDADTAVEYAALVVEHVAAGLPIAMADAQIAAICRTHECTLATRHAKDFDRTGVPTVNPWNDAGQIDDESTRR